MNEVVSVIRYDMSITTGTCTPACDLLLSKLTVITIQMSKPNKLTADGVLTYYVGENECNVFIFFSVRERAVSSESCNLIGSGSGQNFPISDHGHRAKTTG